MRGEHHLLVGAHDGGDGIIPACAGSTGTSVTPISSSCWIIPACAGSTQCSSNAMSAGQGSSPHARGAPSRRPTGHACPGDHPRMRGEHDPLDLVLDEVPGIIPACAGSTVKPAACTASPVGSSPHARGALATHLLSGAQGRDHPRMRGEHVRLYDAVADSLGIIPACAGSTVFQLPNIHTMVGSSPHARGAPTARPTTAPTWRDHPRMRGEHRPRGFHGVQRAGIIPACAGSTMGSAGKGAGRSGSSPHARGARGGAESGGPRAVDHPRMRGEHVPVLPDARLARGIIPACAGSTTSTTSPTR